MYRVLGRFLVASVGVLLLVSALPTVGATATPGHGGSGQIDWEPCETAPEVDCGRLTVPVDWTRPGGEQTSIFLARRTATDPTARVGTLLVNPGGPAVPVGQVVRDSPGWFDSELYQRFDVIGFDPRGSGESSPVRCTTSQPWPGQVRQVTNEEEFAALKARNLAHFTSCREHTGPLLDFLDTASVVRDMEAIRAALSEPKLNFLGRSYGTLLGQQYAERYPHRVGRFALDSNMDHSLRTKGWLLTGAHGSQEAFEQWLEWCHRTSGCPLRGTDIRALTADLFDRAERGELIVNGNQLGTFSFVNEINFRVSQPASGWYQLASLMASLRDAGPDQSVAAATADIAAGADPATAIGLTGAALQPESLPALVPTPEQTAPVQTYENTFAAFFCQDWSLPVRNFAELERLRHLQEKAAPDVKVSYFAWLGVLQCAGLEDVVGNPQRRLRIHGADPMLLVHARYDSDVPVTWGLAVARQSRQQMLIYEGGGHVATVHSRCARDFTHHYLFTGERPAPGTTCPAVDPVIQ